MELEDGGSADLYFAAVPRLGLFSPRRKALTLLEHHMASPALPNEKRLSDAPPKLTRRADADGVG